MKTVCIRSTAVGLPADEAGTQRVTCLGMQLRRSKSGSVASLRLSERKRSSRVASTTDGTLIGGRNVRVLSSLGGEEAVLEMEGDGKSTQSSALKACGEGLARALVLSVAAVASVANRVLKRLEEAGGDFRAPGGAGLLASAAIPAMCCSGMMEVLQNQTFMAAYFSWLFAQLMKVPTHYLRTGKWRLESMVAAGGMPSSHSSLCMGITTSVAMQHGLSSSLFPVCLGFSLIVMYDAAGVRRHAGKQAEVINKLVADVFSGKPPEMLHKVLNEGKELKEVLGHTPVQVFAGAVLGVCVAQVYGMYFHPLF
eukprot:CAMPEP_0118934522 /NCGR_PEP_ID=MMETSP1169-20130426/13870_1 /TAXON_ID=36882 /ORGANISM="Pyramimonas obovata, Strain CCMP722" /LENGTH=309 /DNA_ID=CAMNT_0006877437 /DNA_START=271 /DNA_END=1200 /DNA_ORIENTATION=+